MVENLNRLYNTMILIETKGESTKIMTDCLRFLEQMISTAEKQQEEEFKQPFQDEQ